MEPKHNLRSSIPSNPSPNSRKQQLDQLVQEACENAPGSPERQRRLTQIITILSRSLWRESNLYYEDALQDTYCFLCRRLCDLYDPTKASVTTWINNHLKWRLHSLKIKGANEQKKRAYVPLSPDDGPNPIDNIPSPATPEESITDFVRSWATEDADSALKSKHLQKRPEINCQMLILRRLPPEETTWNDLSKEFAVNVPTLSALYQRHCVPRLRKFVEELDIGG
jgi:hypothetical protein